MTPEERVLHVVAVNGPVTLADIARMLHLPRREVEQAVQQLRLSGEAICSGDRGIWLARDAEELAVSNGRLRHRLSEQYRTLRAQRAAERRLRERKAPTLWS